MLNKTFFNITPFDRYRSVVVLHFSTRARHVQNIFAPTEYLFKANNIFGCSGVWILHFRAAFARTTPQESSTLSLKTTNFGRGPPSPSSVDQTRLFAYTVFASHKSGLWPSFESATPSEPFERLLKQVFFIRRDSSHAVQQWKQTFSLLSRANLSFHRTRTQTIAYSLSIIETGKFRGTNYLWNFIRFNVRRKPPGK